MHAFLLALALAVASGAGALSVLAQISPAAQICSANSSRQPLCLALPSSAFLCLPPAAHLPCAGAKQPNIVWILADGK
jgi:hypothetical protein